MWMALLVCLQWAPAQTSEKAWPAVDVSSVYQLALFRSSLGRTSSQMPSSASLLVRTLPLSLRLRGGGRPDRVSSAERRSTPEAPDIPTLNDLGLPDDSETEDGEVVELERNITLEDEFVKSKEDEVDSDFEPFLGDSDFMENDGWDLAGAREYHASMADFDDDEERAQLVVPDMIESIPAAVRGAELSHRDTNQVPLVFVKKGEYRWRETIVLIQKYEVDVPPFSELQPGLINNSTTHWKYESPIPALNSTLKRVRLRMTGEIGALLWGRWYLDVGVTAGISMLQLLTDDVDDDALATLAVMSAQVTLEACGILSVGGTCACVGETGALTIHDCQLGGLGSRESERSWVGVSVWDTATAFISASTFTQVYTVAVSSATCVRLLQPLYEALGY